MKIREIRGEIGSKGKATNSKMEFQNTFLERSCDLLEEFYGHRPSEGTIVAACAEAAQKAAKSNEAVKEPLVV